MHDRPVLGGCSSSELRIAPYGCSTSSAWSHETGIINELILQDRATNHQHIYQHGMANSHWDLVLEEAVRNEPNLTLYLNTTVRGVDSVPVDAANPGGARRITPYTAAR